MDDVSRNDLNLIEFLQFDRIDKGEVSTGGKYKVSNERWFKSKKGDTSSGDLNDATNDNSGDKVNFVRDTIVKLLYKRGKSQTTEFYRILVLLKKYCNKWFLYLDDRFVSCEHGMGIKNPRVLTRIMENRGSLVKEVNMEKGSK